MPIDSRIENDNWIVFTVTGQLGKVEYDAILKDVESKIQEIGEIKLLVLLENFTGWEPAPGWEDTSFSERNDQFIKKYAIVGDAKWRDLVTVFTLKGLRPVPIQYFLPEQLAEARQWLAED